MISEWLTEYISTYDKQQYGTYSQGLVLMMEDGLQIRIQVIDDATRHW